MGVVRPPVLAFSTLGTPGWGAAAVVHRAASMGFDAVEWRGGPDGTVRTDWSPDRRARLRATADAAGVQAISVTAYSELISGDAGVRARSVDDLVAHAILAAELGARWIRAFVGVADDAASAGDLRRRAVDCLREALERLAPIGVGIGLEPHDDHVRAVNIRPILDAVANPALGVVWDVANAWAAGEDPATGLDAYDGHIAWVQVKDGIGRGRTWRLVPIGAGEVPLREALDALRQRCATRGIGVPPISVEWELAWHPELEPPDVALPAAVAWLRDALDRPIATPASAGTAS